MKPILKIAALAALAALAQGCAFAPRYESLEAKIGASQYAEASQILDSDEKKYGDASRLLYLFDSAWVAHLAGSYAKSNAFIEKANTLIDELYSTSLSKEALSFLGNDMSLPYLGENFERVMLHVLGMLNYAAIGDTDAALVEARRADERLKQYVAKAGKDKVVYQEDALARYLGAALYESEGGQSLWDAFIDYKKCDEAFGHYAKAYGTAYPKLLERDLLKMSSGLGEKENFRDYSKRFGSIDFTQLKDVEKNRGEVIVLLYEGMAPVKVSESMQLPIVLEDGTKQYFSAALPRFQSRQSSFASAWLNGGQGARVPFELFQDLSAIAIQDLKDRVGMIMLKTIARATAKFQAARAIQAEAKKAGGAAELFAVLGTNLYGIISEQADTRSWRTLPGRILMARLALDPGIQSLRLEINKGGRSDSFTFENVKVRAGKKLFLTHAIY